MVYTVELDRAGRQDLATMGGKGANLGELTRVPGVHVPTGYCVTTDAFARVAASAPVTAVLDGLAHGGPAAAVRQALVDAPVPDDLAAAITAPLDGDRLYAVRSSATAEDLAGASSAGQHDSYLDIAAGAVLDHVRRCWASLFTDRAVAYREQQGLDHRRVRMAVVVQEMVRADAAGVLFTADPVTSDRTVTSIEAVAGLGEGLVSGRETPDHATVRHGEIVTHTVAGDRAVLSDAQLRELAQLGQSIAAHFGRPQDIEWCLSDGAFSVVQSRPITTLFPIPENADGAAHVYVSVGHQQMMTDAMAPLGLSFWQLTTPRPMAEAGGRLFVDVAPLLAAPGGAEFVAMFERSDPLIGDALRIVLDRGLVGPGGTSPAPRVLTPSEPVDPDPAVVEGLIETNAASVARLHDDIRGRTGTDLLDFVAADLVELKRLLFDARSHQVLMTGMEATWWLNEHLEEWLGETNAADTLALAVPHNVTAEMGLDLLDLADVIRPYPEVVAWLESLPEDGTLDGLEALSGGTVASEAIGGYLERYGMRGVGEIDITRPRWAEQPAALVPTLVANIRNFAPGAAARRVEQGRAAARAKEQDVLQRLAVLPDGAAEVAETAAMIARVRTFTGYREYPKYGMVSRYAVYRRALLAEADRLVADGVLPHREDVYLLRFDELRETVRTRVVDVELLRERAEELRAFRTLTAPRVFTSDGEVIDGAYRRADVPPGALPGLPVSAGTMEGRARVITDMARAGLGPGDILVTRFTDPSWTPLFVTAAGLVTEVGGQMTHGAVIAREYGLPAVVGVVDATRRIADGQRIRVHGTGGYVELLTDPSG